MLREIFRFLIVITVAAGDNLIDFNNWTIDYSPQNVIFNRTNSITLTFSNLNWPGGSGSRIHSLNGFTEGSYCMNLNLELSSGTVFAFYVSSGEPVDRSVDKWDELDFEFPYPQTVQNHAWVNAYHDGQDIPVPNIADVPNKLNAHYCITWNIGPNGFAVWSIDGVIIYSMPLDTWVKPLKPYISFWGASPGEAAYDGFTGVNSMSDTAVVEVSANNCYLSSAQEVFATPTPSAQPVTFLPTFIHGVCKSGTPCQGCQFCDSGELCPNACVPDAPSCPFCDANSNSNPNSSRPSATAMSAIDTVAQASSLLQATVSSRPPGICPLYKNTTVGCSQCQYCPDGSLCNTCFIPTTIPTNSPIPNPTFAPSTIPSRTPTLSTSSPSVHPSITPSLLPSLFPSTLPTTTPSNNPSTIKPSSTLKPRAPITLPTLTPFVQQSQTKVPSSFVITVTSIPAAEPTATPTPLGTGDATANSKSSSGPLLSTGVLIGGIIGVIVVILVLSYTMLMCWGYRRELSKNDSNDQVIVDTPKGLINAQRYFLHRHNTDMTHIMTAYDQEQPSASASASSVSGSVSDSHSATSHVDYFDHHSEVSFESVPQIKSPARERSASSVARIQSFHVCQRDGHGNSYSNTDPRSSFDRMTDRTSLSRMGPPTPLPLSSLATSLHTTRGRNDRGRESFTAPIMESRDLDIDSIAEKSERLNRRSEGTKLVQPQDGDREGTTALHTFSKLGSPTSTDSHLASSLPNYSYLKSPIPKESPRSSTCNIEQYSKV